MIRLGKPTIRSGKPTFALTKKAATLTKKTIALTKETFGLSQPTLSLIKEIVRLIKKTVDWIKKTVGLIKETLGSDQGNRWLVQGNARLVQGNCWLVQGKRRLDQGNARFNQADAFLGRGKPELGREETCILPFRGTAGHALAEKVGMTQTTTVKLITGFGEYSADGLAHLGSDAAGNLLKLPIFTSLQPTPAEINTQVQSLLTATGMYGPGRAQAISAAFTGLASLLSLVAANAPQVKNVTDTDLAAIGIPLVKKPTRTTESPEQVQNVMLYNGPDSGEMRGTCDPAGRRTRVYEAQWTLDPNNNSWSETSIFPNSRSLGFTGLARGKDVWVRVRARNVKGAGAWSNPAVLMVA